MMGLLIESVSIFEETWIECLRDLARYRIAIKEADLSDREIWSGVARMWYNKAADKSPNVGRIQHHLAVLARPNIVQQLFYYSKALASVVPFPNARESITLLFHSFLEASELASGRYPLVELGLIKTHGVQFTLDAASAYALLMISSARFGMPTLVGSPLNPVFRTRRLRIAYSRQFRLRDRRDFSTPGRLCPKRLDLGGILFPTQLLRILCH